MFIKRLEIFGFKSFKNRTLLDFASHDITGVVGPNGCGKSNIVDALLWVMGENSPKSLRGETLSDIIFGGTNKLAPSHLAEVKLILRAGDQGFPALYSHFSEVMISRRLFRDGKSESFINGKECLLKDVREFFMNTGAGCKGFSIIEQESIEKLITARPAQRRFIIEEVAGISKFKSQKSESLRKLNLVNQNLKRVEDILQLQEAQLKQLKSQAKKAEKYKKLKKELEGVEQKIFSANYQSLVADQKQILLAIQKKEQELKEKKEGLEATKKSLNALVQEIKGNQEHKQKSQEELNKIRWESSHLQDKAKSFEWVKNLQVKLEKAKAKEQELWQKIFEFHKGFDRDYSLNDLKREWVKTKTYFDEKQKNQSALSAHSDLLNTQIEFIEKEIQNLYLEKQEFEDKIRHNIQNKNRVKEQLQKQSARFNITQKKLMKLKEKEKQAVKKSEHLEKEEREGQSELKALAHKQVTMGKLLQKWDSFNKLGTELVQSRPEQFYSLFPSIKGDPDYIKALSAVLGPLEQALVPKDFLDLEWAVEKLKQDKKGRIYFLSSLPQAPVDEEQKKALRAYPAVLGFLEEKIQCQWGLDSLKRTLEGTVVVSNFKEAVELKKQFPSFQFVTKEGDFVRRDSFIYAGSSDKESSFFEIRKQLEELDEQISSKKFACSAKEIEKNSSDKQRDQIQQKSQEIEKLFQELSKHCQELKNESELIKQDTLRNQEMRDRNDKKIRDFEVKKENLVEHQVISHKDIKKQEEILVKKQAYLKILDQALENKKAQQIWQKEKSLLLNVINSSKSSSAKLSVSQIEQALKENKKQKGDLEGQMSLFQKSLSVLEQKKNQQESDIKKGEQALFAIRLSINEMIAEKDKKELEKSHIQSQFKKSYDQEVQDLSHDPSLKLEDLKNKQNHLLEQLDRIKELNFMALKEYEERDKEQRFLIQQKEDLAQSQTGIRKLISHIDKICQSRFDIMLEEINKRFSKIFPMVFQGDTAKAELILCEDKGEQGLDILIHPPGKKLQSVSLLSRGEKALTAVCLIYSLFLVKASPFCIIDEADAPLDDANIFRFLTVLKEMSKKSQIIVITHNKYTMQNCDKLYGVTQETSGVSQLVSVDMKPSEKFSSQPLA